MNRQIYPLDLGCTEWRHKQIGIDAVVNARAGRKQLNDQSIEDVEMMRDAIKIRERIRNRVIFRQFNSRFFRRQQERFAHLMSGYGEH